MRRGDVWLFNLEPAIGSEANKVRPVVIVSNDGANAAAARSGAGVVTVVPLTTSFARVYPFQVVIEPGATGLRSVSKAQAEQVRSLSAERAVRRLGAMRPSSMAELDQALRLHLALG